MKTINRLPHLKKALKFIYDKLNRLPPVSGFNINNELIRACVGKENPTILEIGCNDGTHTLWLSEIFENPIIYCFEPDPRAIKRFKMKVGQHPNISLFEVAISDKDGEIDFYQSGGQFNENRIVSDEWDLSSSIKQPKEHLVMYPKITFDHKIRVTTSTLDTFCNHHGIDIIDFIWMDVQGAEINVFRGGEKALTKTRFLYTEYSNRELYKGQYSLRKLMNYLVNFEVLARYPEDVLFSNKILLKRHGE